MDVSNPSVDVSGLFRITQELHDMMYGAPSRLVEVRGNNLTNEMQRDFKFAFKKSLYRLYCPPQERV